MNPFRKTTNNCSQDIIEGDVAGRSLATYDCPRNTYLLYKCASEIDVEIFHQYDINLQLPAVPTAENPNQKCVSSTANRFPIFSGTASTRCGSFGFNKSPRSGRNVQAVGFWQALKQNETSCILHDNDFAFNRVKHRTPSENRRLLNVVSEDELNQCPSWMLLANLNLRSAKIGSRQRK